MYPTTTNENRWHCLKGHNKCGGRFQKKKKKEINVLKLQSPNPDFSLYVREMIKYEISFK